MEQITREEMIELLSRVEAAMEFPYQDPMILQNVRKAKAALQAAEPVAYLRKDQLHQIKTRGPAVGEIAAEPRSDRIAVYALPCPPAKALVPEGWDAQAYETMRDEITYWKNRALEMGAALERMARDMAPTHMGEPVFNVSRDHQADAWLRVVGLLNELSPGWIIQEGLTAEEAALKTIRELTASPAPDHSDDGNEMVEILKWIASGETAKGCYDGSDEVGAIRERVASFLARHHRQGGAER